MSLHYCVNILLGLNRDIKHVRWRRQEFLDQILRLSGLDAGLLRQCESLRKNFETSQDYRVADQFEGRGYASD